MEEHSNISIHQDKNNQPDTLRSEKDTKNLVIPYETAVVQTEENKIIHSETPSSKINENNENKNIDEKNLETQAKTINCLDKFCGQTTPGGSISGAIFAMTSLSIGTGCLTFTKRVIQFGFVWFGVALIIGGIATYWTLVGLIKAAKKVKDTEYSSSVRKVIGKFPAVLVDVMTIIYSWGLIITYEIIMNSLIGRVIYTFFKNKEIYPSFNDYADKEWNSVKIKAIVLVSMNVLLTPLCLAKDIGKMKFFSLFGIIALFYTIIVLIV